MQFATGSTRIPHLYSKGNGSFHNGTNIGTTAVPWLLEQSVLRNSFLMHTLFSEAPCLSKSWMGYLLFSLETPWHRGVLCVWH